MYNIILYLYVCALCIFTEYIICTVHDLYTLVMLLHVYKCTGQVYMYMYTIHVCRCLATLKVHVASIYTVQKSV